MFGLNVEQMNLEQKDIGLSIDLDKKFTLDDMKNLSDEDKLIIIHRFQNTVRTQASEL